MTLTEWARQIEAFASSATAKVADATADEMQALIQEGLDAGVDPWGNPWAPLRPSTLARGRTPPPLTDTGVMRDQVVVAANGDTLSVEAPSPAEYHQSGTSRMARRPMWPSSNEEMPDEWQNRIDLAGTVAMAQAAKAAGLK